MELDVGRELLDAARSAVQEVIQKRTDDEVIRVQNMDITRAAAALLDVDIEEKTIERLLCKYWDLAPSEAHRFIRDGDEERKI